MPTSDIEGDLADRSLGGVMSLLRSVQGVLAVAAALLERASHELLIDMSSTRETN